MKRLHSISLIGSKKQIALLLLANRIWMTITEAVTNNTLKVNIIFTNIAIVKETYDYVREIFKRDGAEQLGMQGRY